MAEITISTEQINEFRNLLVQYLKDCGYEGSVEDGTAIHDAVIKPMALLLTLFKSEADRARAYFSIDKAQEIKDILGDEYDTVVDSILGNWFAYRKSGSDTEATIKLVFSKPISFLQLLPGKALITIDGVKFEAKNHVVFTESDFSAVFNNTENTNEYTVPVVCKTMEPARVYVATDSAVICHLEEIYLQRAVVAGGIKVGNDVESSDDFIERTKTAITTRELVSDRAIQVRLPEEVVDIDKVYVAGYGSTEQMRDVVEFQTVTAHIGNMADIYMSSTPTLYETDIVVGASNLAVLSETNGDLNDIVCVRDKTFSSGLVRMEFTAIPTSAVTVLATDVFTIDGETFQSAQDVTFQPSEFLRVPGSSFVYVMITLQSTAGVYVEVLSGTTVLVSGVYENFSSAASYEDFKALCIPFSLSGVEETVWNAAAGTVEISTSISEGNQIQVGYISNSVVSDAHSFVTSEDQRVSCYSPLCKSMYVVRVEMELAVRQIASPVLGISDLESRISQVAAQYTNQIQWQHTFSVSEFVHYLHANISDIEQVLLPAKFIAKLRDPSDLTEHTTPITGVYDLPSGLSNQISWNTVMFFTDPSWVKVNLYR